MSNGNGHRWSKFWWQDHQADAALRGCSFAARGLWIELLAIAHGSDQPGYVLVNGVPPDNQQLADMLGKTTPREVGKLLAELEHRRVFSRTTEGVIFSRRMVRDAAASETGREHIAKRWNGAKSPDPPNRVPIREPTSKPNGGAYSQAYRPPTRDPIAQSTDSEVDTEKEKKESKYNHLLTTSPVLARVEAACEAAPAETFGAPIEETASTPAIKLAVKTIVGKVGRSLESRANVPIGKAPKLTVVEQCREIIRGPVIEDAGPEPLRRGPQPPQRTVEEQLAWLRAQTVAA